ncbi:Ldh family oxidoreductase [Planctomicrobium sp. SH668]|uniref:Ldh family oxidoreductase n=1 Tax=Planctomicrobium sp. SH668 TaxID=3448126 RepID=UPI003F5B6E42
MSSSLPIPVDPAQEVRLRPEELERVLEKLLVKNCMFQFDAKLVAKRVVEADLYGVPSHGLGNFTRILAAIDIGDIDPRARVLTTTEAPCFAVLNGSRAVGAIAATKAAELAVEKAETMGVGVVVVSNSQTLGAADIYVRLIAEAGMIGLCLTSTGGATVTAPGTNFGAVGNCALAYAVPVQNHHPLVFDSACGFESWGKMRLLERYGIPLPDETIFDVDGSPTTSLQAAAAMLPNGGALGFGLSMLCSILAGPLCGGWMPIHKKRRVDAEDSQHFFIALDPTKFCNIDQFAAEIHTTLEEIRNLPPTNPAEPVRIPGDRGAACYADAMEHGIPVHIAIAAELKELAIKRKIEVSW